jgi:mRNA-degrading endonuclease RelE of RelBE toxin-antitoxin system
MSYAILFSRKVEKNLKSLQSEIASPITEEILSLEKVSNPKPS